MCTMDTAPASKESTAPAAKSPYDGLVSRLVSKLLSPSTIYCQICLENIPNEDAATLVTCGHAFCRSCLSLFLESAIMTTGNVYPKCFHESPPKRACGVAIMPSEIEGLVPSDVVMRYRTLRLKKEDESVRHCPFCDHLEAFPSGSKQRTCTCAECGGMFCFVHANAHIGISCRKYEKHLAKRERKSTTTIKETTIPCPACHAPVEKNGGCDHIFCKSCHAGFCWRCGKAVTSLEKSNHLTSCKAIPLVASASDRWHVRAIRALRRFFSRA